MNDVGLPTGLVFFVFSDIEGSTARWESNRDAMQTALRRHDAILHAVLAEHGGHVFKTVGDQFCSVFGAGSAALRSALEVQRRLAAQDFGEIGGLRVRMAVHAGETDERSGDYFGPAVNRVARLLAAGHGGQILVSGTVSSDASALPPQSRLIDLGWHRLRDIEQPEHIFQLVAPGLQAVFAPLQSLTVTANNLPHQPTSLVGRGEALSDLERLLRNHRFVSIVGTGGVGKTRIAVAAAGNVLQYFRDGAWFINLAPLSDAARVPDEILAGLGAKAGRDSPPIDALLDYLQDRSLLLVIDNCEHVVINAASAISAILAAAAGITVLATSRQSLDIDGEHVYRLSSLGIADSTELFIERATAAESAFLPAPEELPIIAQICRQLDGIPLALELAAPRVRSLSLDDIARRLSERFALLTAGRRDRQQRQQTMRAVIDWSYSLLNVGEQRLFRRLGVFAGTFSFAATCAICGDKGDEENDVLFALDALVDKSLVATQRTGSTRYNLLQSIRAYATDCLKNAGETAALRRRHAQYYAFAADRLYREWDSGTAGVWFAGGIADLDDIRAALQWTLIEEHDPLVGASIAANTYPIFLRMSLLRESTEYCEAALRNVALPGATAAQLHYGISMLYNNFGSIERAARGAERAAELYGKCGDTKGLIGALSQVCQQYARSARYEEALARAGQCLDMARAFGDDRVLALALQRCSIALPKERIAQARAQFEEAIRIFRSRGLDADCGRAMIWWASSEADAGEFRAAGHILREALTLVGDDAKLFLSINISGYALVDGDITAALYHARNAVSLACELRHAPALAKAAAFFAAAVSYTQQSLAVRLFAFSRAGSSQSDWQSEAYARRVFDDLDVRLRSAFSSETFDALVSEGGRLTSEQVLALVSADACQPTLTR
ncbi:MAG: adenylate/guanylate cyclase domain-containing protein [Candidatus Eremiobacteraeota bacterium]|nr:adenylate/guanylate cyclase domain-containing protein [Candidatus Eremiobacteraeota bacterium]